MQKQRTLRYVFIYENPDTLPYILYAKKCTLRYVFIFKMYRIVLIPNYKRTYNQSDHIDK